MGSKTQTQATQQTTTPVNQAALQGIYNQVQSAASTPYTPYNGELVAPVNAQQTTGINAINNAAGYASPYIQSAAGLVQGAANPLTQSQIQQYENPYTQAVVNTTQAQFDNQNARAQNQLKGSIAQQGALGGDRQAVAQAVLSGQQQLAQAPVIANLESQGYNQALQTAAQQFQQNPLAAASSLGNLGVAGQNAALQGANAQIGAGTLQQQTQQAADQAAYQQYQAAQGFPYQQAAFLEQYGLPSALAQGSTSNGVQTGQGPNQVAPYLGAAIAGAGLFLKDGGSVDGYAPGGGVGYVNSPFGYVNSGAGYIPATQASQNTLQTPSLSYLKPQQTSSNPLSGVDLKGLGTSLKNDFGTDAFGGGNILTAMTGEDAWGGSKSMPLEGLSASDYEYSTGGFVKAVHAIHQSIKHARGHFDDGGDVSFSDRFQPATDSPLGDLSRGQAIKALVARNGATLAPDSIPGGEPAPVINPDEPFRMPDAAAVQAWQDSVDHPVADVGPLPKEIINPDNALPPSPMTTAFAPGIGTGPMGANGMPTDVLPVQQPQEQHIGHSLFGANLSDKTRQSLIAAGLGLMASRSPFLGVALGEGGLQGLKAYSDQSAAEQAAAEKSIQHAQEQQRIDLQAKQLAATLENQRRTAAVAPLIVGPDGKAHINPGYVEQLRAEDEAKSYKPTWSVVGEVIDPDTGVTHKQYGWVDPNGKTVTDAQGKPLQASPSQTPPATNPDGTPLTGQAYLDSLPQNRAALAKGIAEYKVNPNSLSVRGGHREQAIADATRFNPDYDGAQFGARSKAVRDFATGTQGNTIRSLDVAMDHLDTLANAAKALQNGNVVAFNKLRNYWREQTGSELPGNFDAIKTIVGSEIAKAIVGGQNALHDRLAAQEGATNAKSPEQIAGVVQSYKALMAGQLHGLKQQYEATTGLHNFNDRLRPSTVAELERAASIDRSKGAPKVGFEKNGYRFKGGDPANKDNWEKI